jgi:hypothetical protein
MSVLCQSLWRSLIRAHVSVPSSHRLFYIEERFSSPISHDEAYLGLPKPAPARAATGSAWEDTIACICEFITGRAYRRSLLSWIRNEYGPGQCHLSFLYPTQANTRGGGVSRRSPPMGLSLYLLNGCWRYPRVFTPAATRVETLAAEGGTMAGF